MRTSSLRSDTRLVFSRKRFKIRWAMREFLKPTPPTYESEKWQLWSEVCSAACLSPRKKSKSSTTPFMIVEIQTLKRQAERSVEFVHRVCCIESTARPLVSGQVASPTRSFVGACGTSSPWVSWTHDRLDLLLLMSLW